MAIATQALRAFVSIAWQQVFERSVKLFSIYSHSLVILLLIIFFYVLGHPAHEANHPDWVLNQNLEQPSQDAPSPRTVLKTFELEAQKRKKVIMYHICLQ